MNEPRVSLRQPSRRDFLRMAGAGAALAAAGGLAACGSGEEQVGTTGGGDAVANVRFTSWLLNEPSAKKAIQSIVDNYEQQSDATIEIAGIPYGEYLDQILLAAKGNNISGVAQLDIAWLATLARLGALADLGSAVRESSNAPEYTAKALESGRYNDTQYGLPWTTGSIGIVGNSELLEQAGVPKKPETVEEFESALEALKGLGGDIIPYAGMTALDQLKDIIPWIWTFGGEIINGDGNVTLTDEGAIQAVQWYKSLLDRGYVQPGTNRYDARNLFAKGRVGFYEDAPIAKAEAATRSSEPNFASKVIPVPRPVKGNGVPQALLWGHVVVVFKGENAEAATDFARWLTSNKDTVLTYFKKTNQLPTTQEALEAPVVKDNEFLSTWTKQITTSALPSPFWQYTDYARMQSILSEQVQAVLVGQASAEEAMKKAEEEIGTLIE